MAREFPNPSPEALLASMLVLQLCEERGMIAKACIVRNCSVERLALREVAGGMAVPGRLCAVQGVADHRSP